MSVWRFRPLPSMMMTALLCFALLPSAPAPAAACSRGDAPTPAEEYAAASAVFTGTVTGMEEVVLDGLPAFRVSVEPGRTYKGDPQTLLLTRTDSDQCGAGFELGQPYLFYGHGVHHKRVTVFDRVPLENAADRIAWLDLRAASAPVRHPPGEAEIEAHYRGGLHFVYGKIGLGERADAFIADGTVYVPLSFFTDVLGYAGSWDPDERTVRLQTGGRAALNPPAHHAPDGEPPGYLPVRETVRYDGVSLEVDGQPLTDAPEPFLHRDGALYVPVRAVAERLGLRVEWMDAWSAVYLLPPFPSAPGPDAGETPVLAMKYMIDVGLGGELAVDRLTGEEITYRYYHGHLPEGAVVQPATVPFEEMLAEEIGHRKYVLQLFAVTAEQEIPLLLSPELVRSIETDAGVRGCLGEKLGRPLDPLPEAWTLKTETFDTICRMN